MNHLSCPKETYGICNFRDVFHHPEDIIVGGACLLFCCQIFKQIRDRITLTLEFAGIKRHSTCCLRPDSHRVINIIRPKSAVLNFFHREILCQLMDNGGHDFQMCQFFCSHIIEHSRDHPVRCGKTLGKIPHGSSYFSVRSAILAGYKLCQLCIGRLDIYRILESFFIIPHTLSAPSFLFPWKRLFHPLP